MVKFYETSSTFNFSWEQVAKAIWNRYPNPFSPHMVSEDTLHREIRGDQLYSRRLLRKINRPPKWGERFMMTSRIVPIVEESFVNPVNKTITTYTRNIGFSRVMTVIEKVLYTPASTNPNNETVAHRQVWVESRVYGFRKAIENFGIEKFRKHCFITVQGLNYILWKMNSMKKDPL